MSERQQAAFARRYLAGETEMPTTEVQLDVVRNALLGGATAQSSLTEIGDAIDLAESRLWDVFPVELPELSPRSLELLEPVAVAIDAQYQARVAAYPEIEKWA